MSPLSLLAGVSRSAVRSPWRFVGASAALVVASLWLASGLTIRSSFEELLPSDFPSVRLIRELQRRVGGDGNVLVNIESLDGPAGLRRAEAMAPVLARELLDMGPEIRAVESEMASTRAWFSEHWPMFASVEELAEARDAVRAEVRRRSLPITTEDVQVVNSALGQDIVILGVSAQVLSGEMGLP